MSRQALTSLFVSLLNSSCHPTDIVITFDDLAGLRVTLRQIPSGEFAETLDFELRKGYKLAKRSPIVKCFPRRIDHIYNFAVPQSQWVATHGTLSTSRLRYQEPA